MSIQCIKAFNDNYIWALVEETSKKMLVVDPGDAQVVMNFINQHSYELEAIVITHHHFDHIGGVGVLANQFPNTKIYSNLDRKDLNIKPDIQLINIEENFTFSSLGYQFKVLETPGHTMEHIVFFGQPLNDDNDLSPVLFCGDTLFSCGCGRVFERIYPTMLNSLNKLKDLPSATQIYCAHEYTLTNIDFSLSVDADNQDLLDYKIKCTELRNKDISTIPVSIAEQLKVNPFFRLDDKALQEYHKANSELELFSQFRDLRNSF